MSQPVTLSARALLLLILALAALSAAIAVGVTSLTRPDNADAASARAAALSQGDRAIVAQLKKVDRSIGSLQDDVSSVERAIGTSRYGSGLRADLNSYFGISGDIRGLIRDTCRNTQDINPPGAPCF